MLNGLRILIADQHIHVRSWMREQLSVIGANSISMAANASDMMRQSRTLAFDIVICDHHLDHKRDGQQLLEELRFEHLLPLRSIFMIATAERKYRHVVAAAEFAPDDYLIKPYTPGQLATRIERALRKKKALKPVFEHLEVCDHEGVLAACDRVVQFSPRHGLDAQRIKAESLVAIGRVEEAAVLYESIAVTRAVPWARMGYAMMLQRLKRHDQAKDEAYRLNEEHPEFMSVYDLIAGIHEEAGEYPQAIEFLERASAITSSSSTERLRRIAGLAETAGDRPKVISSLKRVIERTRRSSMLKVDDYLSLSRSLLDEGLVEEAEKMAVDMRNDTKTMKSGDLASELVSSMTLRHRGHTSEAMASLEKTFALLDQSGSVVADPVTLEIAEEAACQGKIDRAASIIARMSIKEDLPKKLRSRIESLFTDESDQDTVGSLRKTALSRAHISEQIILGMAETIACLEEDWSESLAGKAREALIDAFTLMPRDKRVINAHIRYNSIAALNAGPRHSPTIRKS